MDKGTKEQGAKGAKGQRDTGMKGKRDKERTYFFKQKF